MSDEFTGLREDRVFPPLESFVKGAHIKGAQEYEDLYRFSTENPQVFWGMAAAGLCWSRAWDRVLVGTFPSPRWFLGGRLNVCSNCVDRHIASGGGKKVAIHWEAETGETRSLSYDDLLREVKLLAGALRTSGISKGDRVAIYMGMSPELAIAMLACARIGAVHSVVFGGFGAQALADRIADAGCRLVISQDSSVRRGKHIRLKETLDEALIQCPLVERVIVFQRSGEPVPMSPSRDVWWHDLIAVCGGDSMSESMDAEDPLFVLYTSGTTGKPKGLVHTTGGYAVGTMLTTRYVFDLREDDIYWCTADPGWITGHSYVVYGPLLNHATIVLYEGAADWPRYDRFWSIIDKYRVTVFYTAPTAIRSFIKWGTSWLRGYSLESLRLLGTVGEPISPEPWAWLHREVGKERCPIVDTYWQTETGMHLITPIPGAIPTKPGSATKPFFGIVPAVLTDGGEIAATGERGALVIQEPWPSMARTILGDHERFVETYFSQFPGAYMTGDGARLDAEGYFWLTGRLDDVINVSGHRLGTMEIESALVAHPWVAEAAAVGRPDELKGQSIAAFVTLDSGRVPDDALRRELAAWVTTQIGGLARPDDIRFTQSLPKTRSGKIMRRLLRELATTGSVQGDVTTAEDLEGLAKLQQDYRD